MASHRPEQVQLMAGPVAVETGATYSEKQGTERLQDHLAAALILTLPHRKFALGRRRRDHRFPLGLLCCRCHSMQPTAYSACCGDGPRSASAHRRVIGLDQARKCADVVDAACAETGSARPCRSWYRHALSLRFFKQFELNGPGREGHFNRLPLRRVRQFLRFPARVLEDAPMRHRLDQELGQPPHQRIEARPSRRHCCALRRWSA